MISLRLPGLVIFSDAPDSQVTTIDYTYDGLYRLTAADYSDGTSYQYAYDAVGNRLTQETVTSDQSSVSSYQYDEANRLTSVDGVTYTWDANGNLLSDGENTYTYDSANRLISVSSNQGVESSYTYSGLGDRLSQTVDGQTTTYTLDLNAGLTQVLDDGENTYLYGNGRIAQLNTASPNTEYFLGDALGSVRQMTDPTGEITLTRSYDPYGKVLSSTGDAQSSYGYTGEQTDPTGMVYLRARYYAPYLARFTTRDVWDGNANRPMSYNSWLYGYANPVTYVDPTGRYGRNVHYDMTLGLVRRLAKGTSLADYGERLARTIAWWDNDIDYATVTGFKKCRVCHFESKIWARQTVELAIESGEPYLFGAALHQFQDTYSHYDEGYYGLNGWGHIMESLNQRSFNDFMDFYYGYHYDQYGNYYESPHTFQKSDVVVNVQGRNLALDMDGINDWDLIDLFLRTDGWKNKTEMMDLRNYFGFNVELYVEFSTRDLAMNSESSNYIQRFLTRLASDDCGLQPDDFVKNIFADAKQKANAALLQEHKLP